MKYKLFRSPGNLDKAVRKHELVAVETGKNIDDVADALIRDVYKRQAMRPMEKPSLYMEKIICTYALTASSTMSWFLFSGDFM